MLPWAHHEWKSKTTSPSVQPFFHSSRQSVVGHVGVCPSPQNCPFPWLIWNPHLIHSFLGHDISISSAVCAGLTAECPYTQKMGCPISPKIALSHGRIWTKSNTCFLEPTWAHNPNSISTGSCFLQGSRLWQTDRPRYSVCNNRLHTVSHSVGFSVWPLWISSGQWTEMILTSLDEYYEVWSDVLQQQC